MTVPSVFQQPIKVAYPPGNAVIFEQWLMDKIYHPGYLNVNWCGFFVNNNYGKNDRAMRHLQTFVDRLDRTKKYWTVTQYDLGIITDISHLDIKVFGSGGGRIDFPIPLICHPHGKSRQFHNDKTYFASFTGGMTHPIRKEILKFSAHNHWYVYDKKHSIEDFTSVLANSIFALCPRGFGLTSFRICEALEQGAIPVYISDEWIVPGNIDFNSYGVLVHSSEIRQLDKILHDITPEQIEQKRKVGKEIYQKIYTFEGAKQLILENI